MGYSTSRRWLPKARLSIVSAPIHMAASMSDVRDALYQADRHKARLRMQLRQRLPGQVRIADRVTEHLLSVNSAAVELISWPTISSRTCASNALDGRPTPGRSTLWGSNTRSWR